MATIAQTRNAPMIALATGSAETVHAFASGITLVWIAAFRFVALTVATAHAKTGHAAAKWDGRAHNATRRCARRSAHCMDLAKPTHRACVAMDGKETIARPRNVILAQTESVVMACVCALTDLEDRHVQSACVA